MVPLKMHAYWNFKANAAELALGGTIYKSTAIKPFKENDKGSMDDHV
jgi:hypothetical protein